MIVVDAMNVIGSTPDGWWRDRGEALARLMAALSAYEFDEWVVVVADGRPVDGFAAGTHGEIELRYATRSGRDAADDDIVSLLAGLEPDDCDPVTVVTSDVDLLTRVRAIGARTEGSRRFRQRVGW